MKLYCVLLDLDLGEVEKFGGEAIRFDTVKKLVDYANHFQIKNWKCIVIN